MNDVLTAITIGLWVNSAAALHSDQINNYGSWLFFFVAVVGSVTTYNLI